MPSSKLHRAALAYAASGIPIFPCVSGGKAPATEHGFYDSSTDPERIDAWWAENPDYNIGLCPEQAGWAVIDIEATGEDAWSLMSDPVPETFQVRSPRGGRHLYFEGSLPPSVKKLFKGEDIDTRGRRSYVLLPPSIVNGKPYEVINDRDVAPLPDWIGERLGAATAPVASAVECLDLPGNIERARGHLRNLVDRGDVAVSGSGGNNRTYQVACDLLDLGLSRAKGRELLIEIWNPRCLPPWDEGELNRFFENAERYAQNEVGAYAAGRAEEVFANSTLDTEESADEKPARRNPFWPEDDDEMDLTPEAQWLLDSIIQHKTTVMAYGSTQSFKTFIVLALAMAVATGKRSLGFEPKLSGCVFYAAAEGRDDIKRKRRVAWRLAHEVEGKTDFYVMRAPMLVYPEEVQQFGDAIRARAAGRPVRMIVLDTTSKVMVGLDPTKDAPRFIKFCESLIEAFGCTVVAVHHTGHDNKRGPRDSSAYHAGFDTVIEIDGNNKAKTTKLTVLKHKDTDEPEPFHFAGQVVGPSLVFHRMSAQEAQEMEERLDLFTPAKVGAALKKLKAVGPEHAVTTWVLAMEMTPRNGDPEGDEEATKKTERDLRRLARFKLKAYCSSGRDPLWSLPASA